MEGLTSPQRRQPPLTLQQRATNAAANVLDLCNRLEDIRDEFLPQLEKIDDETLIAVRMGASAIGVWAWLVEAACDHEMLKRVEAKKGGRGNKDDEGEGREATKRQQGYLNGKSPRTIERNSQIVEIFGVETIATHGGTLQDKGYWIAAVSAPDPHEAIEVFVEKKTINPFWEVRDAYHEIDVIKGKREKAKREFNDAVTTVGRKAASDWLEFHAKAELEKLKTDCPIPGFGDRVFGEAQKQCDEQRDVLFLHNAQECLLYVWTKGYRTQRQMVEFTRLPASEVKRVMENLADKGYFIEKEREWKTTQAKGGREKEWCRTDKPMPPLHINLPDGPITVSVER